MNLKSKTVCVYDHGMTVWLAERLVRDFGRVLLFTNWKSDYPRSQDDMIGIGIEGVERISNFWEHIDEVDLFVFPCMYEGDLQEHLVDLGHRVWGARMGDMLERDRMGTNKIFDRVGIPHPEMVKLKGIAALREYLEDNENVYVKVSEYRGDFETFHSETYELIKPVLDELEHRLGLQGTRYEFLVVHPIDGKDVVEFGYDGWCIDGKFPSETIMGYEKKDMGYCCKVKKHSELSPLITDFTDKMSPTLKRLHYRQFLHTEGRTGKEKVPNIIDTTTRPGSPPVEVLSEMLANLGEILWHGADGELVEPVWKAKYGVQAFIDSSWSEDKWQPIHYPDEISKWVKLRNYAVIDGTHYVTPKYPHFDNVGSVVAIGASLDECIEKLNKYSEQIKGHKIEVECASMDDLKKVIEKGQRIGLIF